MFKWFVILLVTLSNYQVAKIVQRLILKFVPVVGYESAIVLPWLALGLGPSCLSPEQSGLWSKTWPSKNSWLQVLAGMGVVLVALAGFIFLGFNRYFAGVKSPIIFYLFTPLIEESIFRGWMYGWIATRFKSQWWPIVITAGLFGLHHLQYFGYRPTPFALFQMTYTFGLGFVFGYMRAHSKTIYPSFITHVIINYGTLYW